MTIWAEIGAARLSELVKQVQAGNEVLLTQGDKPVAKLVPATESAVANPFVERASRDEPYHFSIRTR
jgi:prevent-host-death family protein